MDLESHFARLQVLLNLESAAEKQRFDDARSKLSLVERAARGFVALDVEAVEEGGLAGRSLITYAREDGLDPGGSQIHVGSLVRVTLRREQRDDAPTGVVARRTRSRIAAAFDEPPPDWATDGRVVLELLPSSVTHERLTGAVSRMGEAKRWHEVLSGGAPRFDTPRSGAPNALNAEQQAALELADRAQDFMLVHGPPGTGKTTVLVEVIRRAIARREKVLAAAPSNLAVDNLVERLAAAGVEPLRIGHPARVLPSVLEHTLDQRVRDHESSRIARKLIDDALQLRASARKRQQRRGPGRFSEARAHEREARALFAEARKLESRAQADVLDRAPVVLATLTGVATKLLAHREFDLAVVDEATQSVEPAVYLALLKAGRAVLAGDHLQLPPTLLSPDAAELGISLFERLASARPEAMVTLYEQHRMNEQIMRYPSDALYEGKLRAHPSVAHHHIDSMPLVFIDTAGRGFEDETPEASESKMNIGEAELAASEARKLLVLLSPGQIAVITPYEGQVQRIRALLAEFAELEVDTVDGFQGREKEAIVLSLVRSNDSGELGFLEDIRRMNVALTRARKKLVVIGDGATIARHPFYDGFIRYAQSIGAWVSAWDRDSA